MKATVGRLRCKPWKLKATATTEVDPIIDFEGRGRPELHGEEHLPAPEHHRVLPPREQHGQRHPDGA
eukprot:58634-Alexandrium_andersonii.AAC.1